MPVVEQYELEAPVNDEIVDREELAHLAAWYWEMRRTLEGTPEENWFWADEELQRQRLAAGCEPEDI